MMATLLLGVPSVLGFCGPPSVADAGLPSGVCWARRPTARNTMSTTTVTIFMAVSSSQSPLLSNITDYEAEVCDNDFIGPLSHLIGLEVGDHYCLSGNPASTACCRT